MFSLSCMLTNLKCVYFRLVGQEAVLSIEKNVRDVMKCWSVSDTGAK